MASGRFALLCTVAGISTVLSCGPAWSQRTDQPAASTGGLDEIVVQARRREEKLQSVPIAITAFNNEQLQDQRIQSLSGLQYQVPSLAYRSVGRDSNDIVNLRGLTGVVTYLDEVPLGGVAAAGTGGGSGPGGGAGPGILYDLENVQILKGPQGTLFGRNTTGGAVLIQAKKPTNNFEGYAQIQLGNYDDREFEGAINVPVVDEKLLLRFSTNIAQRDGFTHVLGGPNAGKDLDSRDYWAFRLQVTARPSDDFQNELLVYSNYKHETGTSAFLVAANPNVLIAPSVYNAAESIIARQNELGPRTHLGESVPNSADRSWNVGFLDTATWDIDEHLTLKNIASFIENKATNNHDLDGSSLVILDQYNHYGWQTDTAQATEELQLQAKALDDKLTLTAGGFLLFVHPGNSTQDINSNTITSVTAYSGKPPNATPLAVNVVTTELNVQERSQAVFAQGEYDLSGLNDALDGVKFTAGGRYTWDWRSVANGQYSLIPAFHLKRCSQSGADANCVVAGDGTFQAFSWLVGMDYQITPTTLAYVHSAKGYQSGGFNLLSPIASEKEFKPEYLTDVEVGIKSDWELYGVKARTNIDWYTGWYDSIQQSVPILNPLNGATVTLVTNAAQADIDGVEFEGTIIPFPDLELSGSYSYNHTRYNSFKTLVGDFSGEPFLYAPKNKYTIGGRYHLPVSEDLGDISAFATFSWQGHVYLGLDTAAPHTTQGDVKILNVGVDWNNIAQYPIDLSFFMTNALDSTYAQGVYALYSSTGVVANIYGEPRMWGFKLRYRFDGGAWSEATPAAYTPPPVQPPAVAPVARSYMVFFDFDKSDLTAEAQTIVDQAARNAGPAKATMITVTGHTDTVGSDAYNLRLSKRRAESVATRLEADGIASSEIAIVAKGKRDLLVPTKDGVREPQNRRVTIVYDGTANS